MKNATRGLVAGGLGVALLASGATFALWSDSDVVDGGTITAGNLDVALTGSQWQDVSGDRDDNPHDIDLAGFLIVPGDTIRGTYAIDAALAGDNLVANLSVASAGGSNTGDLLDAAEGVTVTYDVVVDGDTVFDDVAIDAASMVEVYASADNSFPDGLVQLPASLDGATDIEVVVTAHFDADTPDQVRTGATADLAALTVNLEQTRANTVGGYDGDI